MHKKLAAPIISLLFLALFLVVRPASAGGWATVGVTDMPDQPQAQQPFRLSFMVWQHGNKAVHEIYWDGNERLALTPLLTFTSADTGQTVSFAAERGKQPGCFNAEIVLPGEGAWEWTITLDPLHNVTEMQSITVLPAETQAAQTMPGKVGALFSTQMPFFAGLAATVLVALLLLAARLRVSEQSG